jgi:hypothetical protein
MSGRLEPAAATRQRTRTTRSASNHNPITEVLRNTEPYWRRRPGPPLTQGDRLDPRVIGAQCLVTLRELREAKAGATLAESEDESCGLFMGRRALAQSRPQQETAGQDECARKDLNAEPAD